MQVRTAEDRKAQGHTTEARIPRPLEQEDLLHDLEKP
jgi:hypothetical protein